MKGNLIKVEQKHINKGKRGKCRFCPIALALKDRGLTHIFVDADTVSFIRTVKHEGSWYTEIAGCDLPRSARRFIKKFDKEGKNAVKPFNFYLDIGD